ncbi:MAG: adenylyltransferase/cytidyltransferase family protein [Magnetococcales bacterium]|nr:adenylyltransferase/cytidyltransferase family protein [Magnetococcales bacterium]
MISREDFIAKLKTTTLYSYKPQHLSFAQWRKNVTVAYVGMCADLIHVGHLNILRIAKLNAQIVVAGVLKDEAISSYKRKSTIIPYEHRVEMVESIRYVDLVIEQNSLDYVPNLEIVQPNYLVHGSDWKEGVQQKTRQDAIAALAKFSGELIEPEYFKGVSTTDIIRKIKAL